MYAFRKFEADSCQSVSVWLAARWETFESNILPYTPEMACANSRDVVLVPEDYADDQHGREGFEHLRSDLGAFLKNLRGIRGQADIPKQDDLLIVNFGRRVLERMQLVIGACRAGILAPQRTKSASRCNLTANLVPDYPDGGAMAEVCIGKMQHRGRRYD
jgi:hypothetical protein